MVIKLLAGFFSFALLSFQPVFAAGNNIKKFKFNGDEIATLVPQGWEALSGYLNVPVALLSKKGAQEQRTVIQIIPLGDKDDLREFTKFEKDPADFYEQKEATLGKTGGEPTAREPYQENKKDGLLHASIGIQYRNNFGDFLEESHFVETKAGKFYFVKDLVPLDQTDHRTVVSEVINTLSAKN